MDLQYQTVSTQYELANSFGCPVSGIFKLLTELKDFLKEINDLGLLLKSSVLRFMGLRFLWHVIQAVLIFCWIEYEHLDLLKFL